MRYVFILTPMLCYLVQAYLCWVNSDRPHSVMWASYSMANIGLLWYEATK